MSGAPGGGRIAAIDALRGATIAAMILVNNPGSWASIYPPLQHADWHGWTPTDLVFPFFLFLVGTAIVFALQKRIAAGVPRAQLLRKIALRSLALVAIGMFMSGFPFVPPRFSFEHWRFPGVLQRIGVCYGIVATLFVFLRLRALVAVCVACLIGYNVAMVFVPVPGVGAGLIDAPGTHLSAWVDRAVFGTNHLWRSAEVYDPEGLLSTVPALGTCLLGLFAGLLLADKTRGAADKALALLVRGAVLVLVGYVWDWFFPINKKIWTSSYAVFTAGQAMVALGLLAYAIDVRGRRAWWVRPLEIYGRNALTVFVASGLLARSMSIVKVRDDLSLKSWIYETFYLSWTSGPFASLLFALSWVVAWFVVLAWMWRRGIVLRV